MGVELVVGNTGKHGGKWGTWANLGVHGGRAGSREHGGIGAGAFTLTSTHPHAHTLNHTHLPHIRTHTHTHIGGRGHTEEAQQGIMLNSVCVWGGRRLGGAGREEAQQGIAMNLV